MVRTRQDSSRPRWRGAFALGGLGAILLASPVQAAPAFSCGGFALLGGAQLLCSHMDPHAPPQTCTFSWALITVSGAARIDEGSFLLQPGTANATVYQGSGVSGELSPPIVLCQSKRSR